MKKKLQLLISFVLLITAPFMSARITNETEVVDQTGTSSTRSNVVDIRNY